MLELVADNLDTRNTIRDRQRRNMHPYVLLVVLGVGIYVGILVMMETQFLPVAANVTSATNVSTATGKRLSRLGLETGTVPGETYRRLFFHSALIQAIGNGLLLGKFRDNRLASGVKYAAALTLLTLAMFLPFA